MGIPKDRDTNTAFDEPQLGRNVSAGPINLVGEGPQRTGNVNRIGRLMRQPAQVRRQALELGRAQRACLVERG
jgi:hypothetical protein